MGCVVKLCLSSSIFCDDSSSFATLINDSVLKNRTSVACCLQKAELHNFISDIFNHMFQEFLYVLTEVVSVSKWIRCALQVKRLQSQHTRDFYLNCIICTLGLPCSPPPELPHPFSLLCNLPTPPKGEIYQEALGQCAPSPPGPRGQSPASEPCDQAVHNGLLPPLCASAWTWQWQWQAGSRPDWWRARAGWKSWRKHTNTSILLLTSPLCLCHQKLLASIVQSPANCNL